jgi:gamma-glutamyltranspeptidase/glutathione hydrolase
MLNRIVLSVAVAAGLHCTGSGRAAEKPVVARHGMVVSVSPPASEAGVAILKNGGNAVDAAVATAFALAVTYPAAGNIGGGGFMLVYPPRGAPTVIEYRETAPAAATADMFVKQKSAYRHNVVGVPGTVRGMALAHSRYGRLAWRDVLQPAIGLARDGFVLDRPMVNSLNHIVATSSDFAELKRCFGKKGGDDWEIGDRLTQLDLAKTLELIAEHGPDAFYAGPIADQIVAEMKRGDGLISKADLAGYQAKERQPVHGTYRDCDVYGPPPPSSGGITLVEILNILEQHDLRKDGRWSPRTVHLMAEAMRRAFRDRARHLGDSDFVAIPSHLTSKDYARELAKNIDPNKATHSEELAKDIPLANESEDTTHFSVIDQEGMAVANTYTLEHSFGSKIVVGGAGFLLNNEMSDFNWKPGITDRKGAIGTAPNQIAAGKRMLSSQTPTIVAKNGKPWLITGSPGSRTIINTVASIVVNVVDFDMDVQAAVDAPRIHHAWFPDEIRVERSWDSPDLVKRLEAMGHKVTNTKQGDAHSILVDLKTGVYFGAADRRINGKAVGY